MHEVLLFGDSENALVKLMCTTSLLNSEGFSWDEKKKSKYKESSRRIVCVGKWIALTTYHSRRVELTFFGGLSVTNIHLYYEELMLVIEFSKDFS